MTANGADPLLSYEDNTAQLIEPPTEEEMNLAITKNLGHLITVVCTQHPGLAIFGIPC